MSWHVLRRFHQVWVTDAEYKCPDGELPVIHCLVSRELWSGRTLKIWKDELYSMPNPPYPLGPGVLHVAYNSVAELQSHLVLGWGLPDRILDLLTEFRMTTNGSDWRETQVSKHKLIHAAEYFGLDHLEDAAKAEMQQLAVRGGPFSKAERDALISYCESDVVVTTQLLRKMIPHLCLLQAIQRGRFIKTVAKSQHHGIPFDIDTYRALQSRREEIIRGVVDRANPRFDVYMGTVFKHDRMEALVHRLGLPWPRLSSGCLSLNKRVWERMVNQYPLLEDLYECRKIVGHLRASDLPVGGDCRHRGVVFPCATDTSRNKWKASKFVFGQPGWTRGFVQPAPGRAIAYLDYQSQEHAVAAAISRDLRMQEAYKSGDVYIAFGQHSGLLPLTATKQSHAQQRRRLKSCVLGLQYLITEWGLADQLDIQLPYAEELIRAHKKTYGRFWQWVDAVIDHAILTGWQESLLGWRIQIRDGHTIHKGKRSRLLNVRSIANFPIQAGAAEVCRLACNLVSERGIRLLGSVHDALLIESGVSDIDAVASEAENLMVEAGHELLDGFTIRVDKKIVRYPNRLLEEGRDREMWDFVSSRLEGVSSDENCSTSATRQIAPAQQQV